MSGSCYHSILDNVGRAGGKKLPALSARQAGTGLAAKGGRRAAGETLYLFGYMRGESKMQMTFGGAANVVVMPAGGSPKVYGAAVRLSWRCLFI